MVSNVAVPVPAASSLHQWQATLTCQYVQLLVAVIVPPIYTGLEDIPS